MKKREIKFSEGFLGNGHPVFIIAEIGINHNGSLDNAKKLINGAKKAGADAVKFQKGLRNFVYQKINGMLNEIHPGEE